MTDYMEVAERHNAALEAFRLEYSALTPPPQFEAPQRVQRAAKKNSGVIWIIAALFLASVWVSAKHTVPALRGAEDAQAHFVDDLAAVVMVDGALFLLGYALVTLVDHKGRIGIKITTALYLSLAVALAANISQILLPLLTAVPEGAALDSGTAGFVNGVRVIVALLVGASAPINAFVLGDVLALLQVREARAERDADNAHEDKVTAAKAAYREDLAAWESGLRDAWSRAKSRRISIERPAPAEIPARNSAEIPAEIPARAEFQGAELFGASAERDRVRAYFIQNPVALNLKGKSAMEEIGRGLGVSVTTVYAVRKDLKDGGR